MPSKHIKHLYWLTKPGIIAGNSIALIGGYLLASRGDIAFGRLLATLTGTALVIGGSCVINNYIDRDIDQKMSRTKWRKSATNAIPINWAGAYAALLLLSGLVILATWVNWLTVAVGASGFVVYVGFYSYMKRHSLHGTLVGCVSGAMPPVAGYTAVTNHLDTAALLLLLMLTFWQLAHFYAIAMYRLEDYTKAGLPVMPVVKGLQTTKYYVLANIVAFAVAAGALTALHYTGLVYLAIIVIVSAAWLWRGYKGFQTLDNAQWARGMFLFSLIVMVSFSVALSVGTTLV